MKLTRTQSKLIEDLATPADLLTLVEEDKVKVYARFKCDNALATVQEGNEITGVAHGAFELIAPLHTSLAIEALSGKVIPIHQLPVRPANFSSWNTDYPFEHPTPLKGLTQWEAKEKDHFSDKVIAIPAPQVEQNPSGFLSKSELTQPKSEKGQKLLDSVKQILNFYTDGLAYSLVSEPFSISIQDTYVDLNALKTALGSSTGETESPTNSSNDIKLLFERLGLKSDSLNVVLFRVLSDLVKPSQGNVWRAIEKDHHEATSKYDLDNIIIDMSETELVWRSLHGVANLKYASLRQRLGEVKKVLGSL